MAVDAARMDLRQRWWWQWQQIDEVAVDAAVMDLRLRWWWQWQQIDELAVDIDAARMDLRLRRCSCTGGSSGSKWAGSGCSSDRFEATLVVAVAATELAADAALIGLRLRWWWQWQQIGGLAVGAAGGGAREEEAGVEELKALDVG